MNILKKIKATFRNYISLLYFLPFLNKPFPKKPFCSRPLASKETYLRLHKEAIINVNKSIKEYELISGYSISDDFINELALYTQICIKKSKLNFQHGRLLYSVISEYINKKKQQNPGNNKPIIVFETGTARGFSSICMSKAFSDNNAFGIITTIDCISHNEKMFWNTISDWNGPKTRQQLLSRWEEELSRIIFMQGWSESLSHIGFNRINFAFLDAQHTKKDVMREFKYVSNRQKKGDIVIFDDVTLGIYDGVCEAISEIKLSYPYEVKIINSDKSRGYAIATKK